MTAKKPQIYESPDGGLTIFARDFDDLPSNRVQITFKDSPKMIYDECTGWEQDFSGTSYPDLTGYEDPLGKAILSNPYHLDIELCEEYPELKAKWEEYKALQKHYEAWEILKKE